MADNIVDDMLEDQIAKGYLIFVPRNGREMTRDYPELKGIPEFKKITSTELVFVWFFRCTMSPYYDIPDEKKVEKCIEHAFPTKQQRDAKREEYTSLRFSDGMKAAFKRMEAFNGAARIEDYLYIRQVRQNCKAIMGKDVTRMSQEEEFNYTKSLPSAMKAMLETTKILEGGGFGVVEIEEGINETEGWLTQLRRNTK